MFSRSQLMTGKRQRGLLFSSYLVCLELSLSFLLYKYLCICLFPRSVCFFRACSYSLFSCLLPGLRFHFPALFSRHSCPSDTFHMLLCLRFSVFAAFPQYSYNFSLSSCLSISFNDHIFPRRFICLFVHESVSAYSCVAYIHSSVSSHLHYFYLFK